MASGRGDPNQSSQRIASGTCGRDAYRARTLSHGTFILVSGPSALPFFAHSRSHETGNGSRGTGGYGATDAARSVCSGGIVGHLSMGGTTLHNLRSAALCRVRVSDEAGRNSWLLCRNQPSANSVALGGCLSILVPTRLKYDRVSDDVTYGLGLRHNTGFGGGFLA